jgi:hypothetical protein
MIIWMFMAIGLVVIVAGGFVARSRRARVTEHASGGTSHHTTHHGKGSHNSRGRGRGH